MAHIDKRGDRYRVRIRLKNHSLTKTFRSKTAAKEWALRTEAEIIDGRYDRPENKYFREALIRYRDEVSPTKDGHRWELVRINRLLGQGAAPPDPLIDLKLNELTPESFAAWRDRRLQEVSAATVNREWNLLSAVCNRARREWRWLQENPMRWVQRPRNPQPRSRRITDDEIERLLHVCGYDPDAELSTQTALVAAAFLWAIETAMRAGEICALAWSDVDCRQRIVRVRAEAHGARKTRSGRIVPLSRRALALLEQLRGIDEQWVFGLTPTRLDALFRKARDKALIENLHFHDTRREALTRLAARVDVLTLAKISGHKDLKILSEVYYAPDMGQIAKNLD